MTQHDCVPQESKKEYHEQRRTVLMSGTATNLCLNSGSDKKKQSSEERISTEYSRQPNRSQIPINYHPVTTRGTSSLMTVCVRTAQFALCLGENY